MQPDSTSITHASLQLDSILLRERRVLQGHRRCWMLGWSFAVAMLAFVLVFLLPPVFGLKANIQIAAPLGIVPVSLLLWLLISVLFNLRAMTRFQKVVDGLQSIPLRPLSLGEKFGSQRVTRLDQLGIEFDHRLSATVLLAVKWCAGVPAVSIAIALAANLSGTFANTQLTGAFKFLGVLSILMIVWAVFPTPCRWTLSRASRSSDLVLEMTDASILYQLRHTSVRLDGHSKVEVGQLGNHLFIRIDEGQMETLVSAGSTPLHSWHLSRIEAALWEIVSQPGPGSSRT